MAIYFIRSKCGNAEQSGTLGVEPAISSHEEYNSAIEEYKCELNKKHGHDKDKVIIVSFNKICD